MGAQSSLQPRRVAIVDDHELLLDGLTTWVQSNANDFSVVASVTGWLDLVKSHEFPPDVTIMDFQLKEQISIESRVRTCLAAGSQVVVISAIDSEETRARVMAAGAFAFVAKSRPAAEVVDAARRALQGSDQHTVELETTQTTVPRFHKHVLDTLRLYALGNSPVDIAVTMDLPFDHVKAYLAEVRDHYAADEHADISKQELIRRATADGYVL